MQFQVLKTFRLKHRDGYSRDERIKSFERLKIEKPSASLLLK
jgi:hypothetical protein